MENNIYEPIEIATPTNNEGSEEDSIPVKLVDEEERFEEIQRQRICNNPISNEVQIQQKSTSNMLLQQ